MNTNMKSSIVKIVTGVSVALNVILLLIAGIFLWNNKELIPAFMSHSANSNFSACAGHSGKMSWITDDVFVAQPTYRLECIIPFLDGGKACTDGSGCQGGRCIAKDQAASKGAVAEGTCTKDSTPLSCTTTVTAGKSNGEHDVCARI
jgi:hypothetical protein